MTAVKERIIGAVSIMSDKDANIFWHIIQKHFKLPDTFADIEKVEPDETDLIRKSKTTLTVTNSFLRKN